MKYKEFRDKGLDCEDCPIFKEGICNGGAVCYGGIPIEPPCCSFNDDTDMEEYIDEYEDEQYRRREEAWEKEEKAEKRRQRAKKAAYTRQQINHYCLSERMDLKEAKAKLLGYESSIDLARSLAEAFNFTNKVFGYQERYVENPEVKAEIKKLKNAVKNAEKALELKRKQFYAERKEKENGKTN